MAKEMMKEVNNEVNKAVSTVKTKLDGTPLREDLENIKHDARVLRDDAVVLGRDLQAEGKRQLSMAEEKAREAKERAMERGRDGYEQLAAFVQNNPGQSLAFAFVGGMIASLFFSRKG